MAARRLIIVLLILLGISTLAAALVPQHSLRRQRTVVPTATAPVTTTQTTPALPGRTLAAKVVVGGRHVPVVAGPVCQEAAPKCGEPIHVGDQLVLLVYAKPAVQLAVPAFGEVAFAAPNAAARFALLPSAAGTIGIVFAGTDRVAAKVQVLTRGQAKKELAALKRPKKRGR
jgi:hypothetical protein